MKHGPVSSVESMRCESRYVETDIMYGIDMHQSVVIMRILGVIENGVLRMNVWDAFHVGRKKKQTRIDIVPVVGTGDILRRNALYGEWDRNTGFRYDTDS